jgi:hypothetical protein
VSAPGLLGPSEGNGAGMSEETPREVGDVPPARQTEDKPAGADPDTGDTNPERQGPDPDTGPTDAPEPDGEQGQSGPPPESIPGDGGQVPNPRQ